MEELATVPDPRSRQGRRHPLTVILSLTVVATLAGMKSLEAIAQFSRDLLGRVRGHWGIENGLHYVREETLGEDRCRVRRGQAEQVLAAIRNVAVHLLQGVQAPSKAAATRRFAAHPDEVVPLLFT